MKKILFWILTFLWIWLSFCSAVSTTCPSPVVLSSSNPCYSWQPSIDCYYLDLDYEWWIEFDSYQVFVKYASDWSLYSLNITDPLWYSAPRWRNINLSNWNWVSSWYFCFVDSTLYNSLTNDDYKAYYFLPKESWWSSTSDIDVFYNNWNSTETITCDWVQAIQINWLSTITSTNTFTPYFNISYKDEDNQSLIESYSKNILYLENWQFKKIYTWNNDWILTYQWGNSENFFSWYLPTFDITWSIDPNDEFTWNVFNNFADNSLKYLLSNIPSYIQYFIILLILFLILWFVKKFRRK